jgi:hypothetical protein
VTCVAASVQPAHIHDRIISSYSSDRIGSKEHASERSREIALSPAVLRRPRPKETEPHPGGNGGHCYRQMKDVVVNDKVPLGSLQRAEGLL